jgi:GNAT superfamily N-acetyltransferase
MARPTVPADSSPTRPVRLATNADVPAIRSLVHAAYRDYEPLLGRTPLPMLADYGEAVQHHDLWVAEADDDAIVGVIELDRRPDHLWIENVAVLPEHQGRGIGRRLLAHAEDEARRLGYGEVRLLTNERYTANIAMYERYGYHETHRMPYMGSNLVYFRKPLAPEA